MVRRSVRSLGQLLLGFAVVFACSAARGQAPRELLDPHKLYLRHATVDTSQRLVMAKAPAQAFRADAYYVIQLDGPMTAQRRRTLEQAGAVLGDYLPLNAFVARLDNVSPEALARIGFVRWVGLYEDSWKLDPEIGRRVFHAPERVELSRRGWLQLVVTLFAGEDLDAAKQQLAQVGGVVLDASQVGPQGVIDLQLPADRLADLASVKAVQFVEETPEAVLRNDKTTWVIQSNVVNVTSVWDQGVHGENELGGLIDTAMRSTHCAFNDPEGDPFGPDHRKIEAYYGSQGSSSHGTHTAGTFIGDHFWYDGSTYRNGMGDGARVVFKNLSSITGSNLYSSLVTAHGHGARVHSNSWGDDGTTQYTSWCRQIDQYSWDYEDGLVVFAETNLSTLRTPENAKDVLAVGASYQANSQEYHCSGGTGPTSDGRRKPEIFAPGCGIYSASYSSTCGWLSMSGTSMACPAIAGAGLLVRQYFADGFYPSGQATPADAFTPTGALVKAVLLNAAVDMTGVTGYPSNQEGWGRLLLDDALYFDGDARRLFVADVRQADGLAARESVTYEIDVTSAAVPVKMTLVWHDYPAAVNASFAPVNDVDLIVTDPGGTIYYGNVFSGGESAPGGLPDYRNNVEQVHLGSPTIGRYTIIVQGTAINQETQGFALVISGDVRPASSLIGDFDGDGDVDLDDFGQFAECYNGAARPPAAGCPAGVDADLDDDGDVDLDDFSIFAANYTGSL